MHGRSFLCLSLFCLCWCTFTVLSLTLLICLCSGVPSPSSQHQSSEQQSPQLWDVTGGSLTVQEAYFLPEVTYTVMFSPISHFLLLMSFHLSLQQQKQRQLHSTYLHLNLGYHGWWCWSLHLNLNLIKTSFNTKNPCSINIFLFFSPANFLGIFQKPSMFPQNVPLQI